MSLQLPFLPSKAPSGQITASMEKPAYKKSLLLRLTKKLPSPKIRTINMLVVIAASLLLILFLLSSVQTSYSYDRLRYANDKYITCELAANQLKHASNYLTAEVRMFAITQDPKYMEDYFKESLVNRNREQATETLQKYLSESYAYLYLDEAYRYSYELMKREYHAMKLVCDATSLIPGGDAQIVSSVELTDSEKALSPEEKIQVAVNITHDTAYQRYVDLIEQCVKSCIRTLTEERARTEQANILFLNQLTFSQRMFTVLLLIIILLTIIAIKILVLFPMNAFVNHIRNYQPLPMTGAYELRYLASAYNIMYNKNQKTSARLRHAAEHDPLTGLYNRGAFDKLRDEYQSESIALMLIDVDLFKHVNDNYGHDVGDRVLKKVAHLLDQSFRETDFPCRIGGDEFAVIMTNATSGMKELLKGKLQRISEALKDTSDGLPQVTLSIGAAFSDRKGGSNDIYKDADRALYVVKTHGRDGCEFFGEQYVKL